ncbi:hypothetical protein CR513_10104, partial [Mucuna pruriens]
MSVLCVYAQLTHKKVYLIVGATITYVSITPFSPNSPSPNHVTLANNHHVVVNLANIIMVSLILVLFNVLYVPKFNANLLSISRLTKCLDCVALCCASHCTFLKTQSWKMSGTTRKHERLYKLFLKDSKDFLQSPGLDFIPSFCNNNIVNKASTV